MGIVFRTGLAVALVLFGGWLAHENVPPFPALWSLKQSVYDGWQRRALLQRLESLGYRQEQGTFAGRPDPFLLRLASCPDAPLLLDLHPWNNDWLDLREPLFTRFAELDWHVVRPDFGGPVRTSGHCCSDAVIQAIDSALAAAHAAGVPGQAPLLVLGESGGGMTAACWLAKGAGRPRQVKLWGAVTDLMRWQRQTAASQPALAAEISQCTARGATAAAQSPVGMDYSDKLRTTRVEIFAGIHDGFAGTVPASHSVSLFRHLSAQLKDDVTVLAGEAASLSDRGALDRVLVERTGEGAGYPPLPPGRTVHLQRQVDTLSLTLFEGGHELLPEAVLASFCRNAGAGCATEPEPENR